MARRSPHPFILAVALTACGGDAFSEGDDVDPGVGASGAAQARSAALVVSVDDVGAIPNDGLDDGAAFQTALDTVAMAGGGEVFVPSGTYNLDQTLRMDDHTVLRGEDRDTTVLVRSNVLFDVGLEYQWLDGKCSPIDQDKLTVRSFVINKGHNCGNTGIEIRDLTMDGSNVTNGMRSIGIVMLGVKDVVIDNLVLKEIAQDGIFLKNGGVNTRVTNTIIDGFNMHWHNGGGINVEMWGNANNPGAPLLEGNKIVARGPAYCSNSQTAHCTTDADCPKGECPGTTQVVGIAATQQSGTAPAAPIIVDNAILLSEGHLGIKCLGCEDAEIAENIIETVATPGPRSRRGWGMLLGGTDLSVVGNTIVGGGVPDDGRGVLVEANQGLVFTDNEIGNKFIGAASAAVTIRHAIDYWVTGNDILDIQGAPALELGPGGCGPSVQRDGYVADNIFDSSHFPVVDVRAQSHLWMLGNAVTGGVRIPCGQPRPWVFADPISSDTDGHAYHFEHGFHQIVVEDPVIPATDAFTIVARLRPETTGHTGYFLGQHYNVYAERFTAFAQTDIVGLSVGNNVFSTPADLDQENWHWLALSRDDIGLARIHINSALVATQSLPGPIDQKFTTVGALFAGPSLSILTGRFDGDIDELWVFNGALTDAQVSLLHDGWAGPEDIGIPYWDLETYAAAP